MDDRLKANPRVKGDYICSFCKKVANIEKTYSGSRVVRLTCGHIVVKRFLEKPKKEKK